VGAPLWSAGSSEIKHTSCTGTGGVGTDIWVVTVRGDITSKGLELAFKIGHGPPLYLRLDLSANVRLRGILEASRFATDLARRLAPLVTTCEESWLRIGALT
jgi:hypothetical protein